MTERCQFHSYLKTDIRFPLYLKKDWEKERNAARSKELYKDYRLITAKLMKERGRCC